MTPALLIALLSISSSSVSTDAAPVDTVGLEEITITSLKQQNRLSQSPIASTFIGETELERINAVDIKSISDVVPNFYIPDYGSRITSSIYVRGLGARMDQPAVGLSVDNVPFLNKDAYDFDIPDIVSVEMLRGPQSTLYGRNTMGGQINVTTLSPLDYQGWRFSLDAGNGGRLGASAGYYALLRKDMGLSANFRYSHSRGFFKNDFNGKYLDKENSGSATLKFDWRPSSSFRVQNSLSASLLRQGGYPYEYVPTGQIAYGDTCFYRRFLLNDGLTLKWFGENVNIASVTSVQHIDDNMTLDQDFLPLDYFTLTQKKRETGLTQDFIVRPAAPAGVYSWLAGLFAFYKHMTMDAPVTFKDYGIASLIESHRNQANPYYPIEWDTRSFLLNSRFKMPVYGVAAYHESKVDLGNWHILAGLRLEYEHASMRYHSWCDTGYTIYDDYENDHVPLRHVPVDIDDRGRLKKHFLTFMPRLGVLFDIPSLPASNIYLNISRGYKSGGFNTQMFSDVLQQRLMGIMGIGASYDIGRIVSYKPEHSWNYEFGMHLSFPDINFSAEAAAFLIDCRDQQLTMFPDGFTTGRIMTNAGRTRSVGAELSLNWRPGDRFGFLASYGFTKATFRRFFDGLQDYAGKHLPYAPCNTLFFQALYNLPLNGSSQLCRSLDFDVNLRGTGKIYWNEANTLAQPFYALLGAGVTLSGDRASIQLWAKNITNTRYHTFYFVSIGNEFVQRGKPFQLGITLRYNFF